MPQIERRNNIRDILIWLRDTEAKVTLAKLLTFIRVEATDMGCTERTARSYIEDCSRYKLIEYKGNPPRWRITNIGKKWLARRGF